MLVLQGVRSDTPMPLQVVALLALTVAIAGCAHPEDDRLSRFAMAISDAPPVDDNPLRLIIGVVENADQLKLHCALTNVSSSPLQLTEDSLPCAGWWSLEVTGLTTDGQLLPVDAQVGSILSALSPPEITIAPGETVEGQMDLQSVYPLDGNLRSRDVLLLWSYSHDQYVATGIALLPKRVP